MPNWEYKVISSGALGFASLALLEQHLNQLGKEEWEIIHFQTRPDNPLAFQGIARRPVMRDWVVEAPPAAAPKQGTVPAPPEERSEEVLSPAELKAEAEERRESLLAREESLRPVASAAGDEPGDEDDDDDEGFDEEEEDDEDLPTFFEAIRPHMRRNQRGPGMAVGIEYLAKKFEQSESDLVEALKECGFAIPSSAKDQPTYLDYDGDLYWLNLNHRGQLWINTREKPRAVFKPAVGKPLSQEDAADAGLARGRGRERAQGADRREDLNAPAADVAPSAEAGAPSGETQTASPKPQTPHLEGVLQTGPALLDQLRPMMRRSRRGPGLSGSFSYLARALKVDASALEAAFAALGLVPPVTPEDKPLFVEIGPFAYWLNRDKTGQIWINARPRREQPEPQEGADAAGPAAAQPPETPGAGAVPPEAAQAGAPAAEPETPNANPQPQNAAPETSGAALSPLAAARPLLKETRRGDFTAKVVILAELLGVPVEDLVAALGGAGLKVPEKAREKPVFVENAGEVFWLNRNARGELWLNAKPPAAGDPEKGERAASPDEPETATPAEPGAEKKGRRPRRR